MTAKTDRVTMEQALDGRYPRIRVNLVYGAVQEERGAHGRIDQWDAILVKAASYHAHRLPTGIVVREMYESPEGLRVGDVVGTTESHEEAAGYMAAVGLD